MFWSNVRQLTEYLELVFQIYLLEKLRSHICKLIIQFCNSLTISPLKLLTSFQHNSPENRKPCCTSRKRTAITYERTTTKRIESFFAALLYATFFDPSVVVVFSEYTINVKIYTSEYCLLLRRYNKETRYRQDWDRREPNFSNS